MTRGANSPGRPGKGRTAVLVPAAGCGERLGGGVPKALRKLGGVPVLVRAVQAVAAADLVDLIVVAAPRAAVADVTALLGAAAVEQPLHVIPGGASRHDSVCRMLPVLPDDVDVVLVHDAARPLVPPALVDAVAAAVRRGACAVVPGLPVADTIKQVDAAGRVLATPDRSGVVAAQTPQGFVRSVLERAHAGGGGGSAADDAELVQRLGQPVTVVDGHPDAFKITRSQDFALAEALLVVRAEAHVG